MYLLYSQKRCDLCLFLRCLLNELRIKKFKKTTSQCDRQGLYAARIRTLILHTDRPNWCARPTDLTPSFSGTRFEASDGSMTCVVSPGSSRGKQNGYGNPVCKIASYEDPNQR